LRSTRVVWKRVRCLKRRDLLEGKKNEEGCPMNEKTAKLAKQGEALQQKTRGDTTCQRCYWKARVAQPFGGGKVKARGGVSETG